MPPIGRRVGRGLPRRRFRADPAKPRISPDRNSKLRARTRPPARALATKTGSPWSARPAVRIVDPRLVAADDGLDDGLARHLLARPGPGSAPVPKHRDAIGDFEHLRQSMADVEKRVALGGQPPHVPKQDRDFRGQQRRGRFVQDDDPRIAADRLGDRDHGVLIRPELADFGPRVDLESDAIKQLRRAPLDGRPVDKEPDATRQSLRKGTDFRPPTIAAPD